MMGSGSQDVHFCSGQSNMDKTIAYLSNATNETAAMRSYPDIRLLHVGQWDGGRGGHPLTPHTPQGDIQPYPFSGQPNLNWTTPCTNMSDPSSQTCRKKFSAVCWMYGRALFRALDPPRPVGLMQATWGGTSVTQWSSATALARCGAYDAAADHTSRTTLWNSAVVPLLRTTIRTIVWYQGEQDSPSPGGASGPFVNQTGGWPYNCTFPAMIHDWREQWSAATYGEVPVDVPFGYCQLNGNGKGSTYQQIYGDPKSSAKQDRSRTNNPMPPVRFDYDAGGFPNLRWAQSAGYGRNPNAAQPNTFQAIILDTADPQGGIHSPYKEAAGTRLARASMIQAYGRTDLTPGPILGGVSACTAGGTVTVTINNTGQGVVLHTDGAMGFEALPFEHTPYSVFWTNVPIISHTPTSVTLGNVPANATRLRYLWMSNACTTELFKCPVYVTVEPLQGGLSGEHDFLPLGPFLADIPAS